MMYYYRKKVRQMRPRQRVVGKKGQITLPVEMRRALQIDEGDKVVVTREGSVIHVERIGSVVEQTAGVIKKRGGRRLSVRELKEVAEHAIADDLYERMNE